MWRSPLGCPCCKPASAALCATTPSAQGTCVYLAVADWPLLPACCSCDGTGRIMGGLGSVPGFGWWPIKAYRPCGKLAGAGLSYKRKGQDLDGILFGGGKD